MGVPYAEVIGDPIAHSKSPLIHKFWLEKLGIEGDYRRAHVRAGELGSYLASRRGDPDWRGCNVTMPHKAAIGPLLDDVDSSARRIGAVNTVTRFEELVLGLNTDWQGLNLALGEHSAADKDVVLIGAGGAARAALEELKRARPASLTVMNRDPAKAARLIADFGLEGDAVPLGDPPPADLLINASALGMVDYPPLEIDLAALRPGAVVLDMVYHRVDTRLLRQARSMGLETIDGLQMLIGQAAMAFRFFFEASPEPVESPELRELLTR
ncbi:MAG: aroE [Alphaproteobacteria bacterium]|nr:aroE [Alphaproteobacteria bacterium]